MDDYCKAGNECVVLEMYIFPVTRSWANADNWHNASGLDVFCLFAPMSHQLAPYGWKPLR